MNSSKLPRILALILVLAAIGLAADNPAKPEAVQPPPILPQQFGGWQMQGAVQTSPSAMIVDAANAAVLKEYGFTDAALSTYVRDDGRTLKIRAARFTDASGAFGAYTFYLQREMTKEQIGDQGASLGQRVLFYRGHVLVDALFSKESPMSGEQLRELAGVLPRPAGNAGNLPSFVAFMPHIGYVANTEKYAMGPQALAPLAAPISAELIDFSSSPEVTVGKYSTSSGEATLMLVSYPTPQLAAEHLRKIDDAHRLAQPQSGVATVEHTGQFFDKRTGPIVVLVAGPLSESDAKSLLGMVNYEANVTWNENTYYAQKRDANIILNILILCAILCALALAAGLAFGGMRILAKRLLPNRVFDRPEQVEFISLRLTEVVVVEGPPAEGSDAPGSR